MLYTNAAWKHVKSMYKMGITSQIYTRFPLNKRFAISGANISNNRLKANKTQVKLAPYQPPKNLRHSLWKIYNKRKSVIERKCAGRRTKTCRSKGKEFRHSSAR